MTLVTVSWNEQDVGGAGLSGIITFTPSQVLNDVTDGITYEPVAQPYPFTNSAGTSRPLIPNDDASVMPSGSWYTVSVNITGLPARSFTAQILAANGASQTLAFLQSQAIVPVIPGASYVQTTGAVFAGPVGLNGGLAIDGVTVENPPGGSSEFLRADGTWDVPPGGSSAVTSVFGRTGAVAATSGDYAVGQVTGAAPLASPALTGSPTAPTASALTDSTQLATTGYADSAVATEKSRAQTAEGLLAPKASPTFTGTPAGPTAAPLTSSTELATTAYADAAVSVEKSRAQTAEGLLAPLASPALTGSPTAPTASALTDSTQVATTAYADGAVAAEATLRANADALRVLQSAVGAASGVASLDGSANVPAGQLGNVPAGSTSTAGLLKLDGTAGDIAALGSQAAGSTGKAADAGHVHPPTGLVTGVTAADTSVVVGGTSQAPTVRTSTLDVIASQHPPAAAVGMNSQKITSLANGSGAQDAAAFGQIPVIDSTASDIQPAGQSAASGSSGKVPDAKHIHPPGSAFLCTPTSYAPGSQTSLATPAATTVAAGSNTGEISAIGSWAFPSAGVLDASTTGYPTAGTLTVATSTTTATITYTGTNGTQFTGCAYVSGSATGTVSTGGAIQLISFMPVSSASVNTGSFTAPASGDVLVTVSFIAEFGAASIAAGVGLLAHGTTTPMIGNSVVAKDSAVNEPRPFSYPILVTGLTPGSSYNFDLAFCMASGDVFTIIAIGQTSLTPVLNNAGAGGPVVMTVQGV